MTITTQDDVINFNRFVDRYNSAVDKILKDAELMKDFETILDEQKAIAEINGGLSEAEAERLICDAGNIRRVVMRLI